MHLRVTYSQKSISNKKLSRINGDVCDLLKSLQKHGAADVKIAVLHISRAKSE